MSDIKDKANNHIEELARIEKIKQENQAKKIQIDSKRVESDFQRMLQHEKDLEIARTTDFNEMTDAQIEKLRKDNKEYIAAARQGMNFICDEFDGIVPFFQKNLILIGGKTGEGKSTTVANIAWSVLNQRNPITGEWRRVCVLTNEEKSEDFFNRITCLANGWHYTNHDKFTDEQVDTFDKWIPRLASKGRLNVIDNNYNGATGSTTSIEGLELVFDSILKSGIHYDVYIIDYYQNIKHSKNNPRLNEWEVQALLANKLDQYKNVLSGPIVLFAQVNPPDKEEKVPFEHRIKGRKVITDPSTFIMEMQADRPNLRTRWIVHKSRFTESVGKDFFTGYDHGKFVPYSTEFQAKVARVQEEREYRKVFKADPKKDGLKDVFKEEKKEGEDGNSTEGN